MRRQGERGLATAVLRGWQLARGEVLGVMDADLQHPPEVNLELLREIDGGADLAAASRHVEGGGVSDWSYRRRLLSRGAQLLGLLTLPGIVGRLSDPLSGYFMVRRSAIAGVTFDPVGYKVLIEVVARGAVGRIAEVAYVFRERAAGSSKVTARVYLQYLRHLARLRRATLWRSRFVRFCLVGATGPPRARGRRPLPPLPRLQRDLHRRAAPQAKSRGRGRGRARGRARARYVHAYEQR